jgi:hypothetical protein
VKPWRASAARRSTSSERESDARVRLGQDLLEQVLVLGMDVQLEPVAAVLLQPRPRDDATVLGPEADAPFRLATLVLAKPPGDVADVPRRTRAEQAALLERELLHVPHDSRAEAHRGLQ